MLLKKTVLNRPQPLEFGSGILAPEGIEKHPQRRVGDAAKQIGLFPLQAEADKAKREQCQAGAFDEADAFRRYVDCPSEAFEMQFSVAFDPGMIGNAILFAT